LVNRSFFSFSNQASRSEDASPEGDARVLSHVAFTYDSQAKRFSLRTLHLPSFHLCSVASVRVISSSRGITLIVIMLKVENYTSGSILMTMFFFPKCYFHFPTIAIKPHMAISLLKQAYLYPGLNRLLPDALPNISFRRYKIAPTCPKRMIACLLSRV